MGEISRTYRTCISYSSSCICFMPNIMLLELQFISMIFVGREKKFIYYVYVLYISSNIRCCFYFYFRKDSTNKKSRFENIYYHRYIKIHIS